MRRRWIWMAIPALMLSAPAWSWCDHDSDDPALCKYHGIPEPGTLSLLLLGTVALLPASLRRRNRR